MDNETERKERREDAIRSFEHWSAMGGLHFTTVIAAGSGALKLIVTVNAGALVALLGFTAGLAGKERPALTSADLVIAPMSCFALGIVLAVAAVASLYFTQNFYAGGHYKQEHFWESPYIRDSNKTKFWDRLANIGNGITIALGILSYLLFMIGIWRCFDLIRAVKF